MWSSIGKKGDVDRAGSACPFDGTSGGCGGSASGGGSGQISGGSDGGCLLSWHTVIVGLPSLTSDLVIV